MQKKIFTLQNKAPLDKIFNIHFGGMIFVCSTSYIVFCKNIIPLRLFPKSN